jgi:hypothetical protein
VAVRKDHKVKYFAWFRIIFYLIPFPMAYFRIGILAVVASNDFWGAVADMSLLGAFFSMVRLPLEDF